jgi:transposase
LIIKIKSSVIETLLQKLSNHPILKERGIVINSDIESLLGMLVFLLDELQSKDKIIAEQKLQIEELTQKLNQNSNNSHKPPSSDGYRKASTPRKEGGKQGGQEGHIGKSIERRAATEEKVVKVETDQCECGSDLTDTESSIAEVRQVIDIPIQVLDVINYNQEKKVCTQCGKVHLGVFPKGVEGPVQYGNNTKTLAVLLGHDYKIPVKRISQLLGDLYGIMPNVSTIIGYSQKAYDKMKSVEGLIKEKILETKVAHADETGIRVKSKLHWLHVLSTAMYSYFFIHAQRGNGAMQSDASLLKDYQGICVHDSYSSYFTNEKITHALCGSHVIRELNAQEENGRPWASKIKTMMLNLKQNSEQENVKNKTRIYKEFNEILKLGKQEEPPPIKTGKRGKCKKSKGLNLIERLEKEIDGVLLNFFDPDVPFTNNQAERDFRFSKVKMKVSNCFRSFGGASHHARIMSVISTTRKHKMNVFDTIKNIFQNISIDFVLVVGK